MNRFSHKAMDTEFVLSFPIGEARLLESAASSVFALIDRLEELLSRFNDTSDVAVIAALKPGEVTTIAPETMRLLVASAEVCAATAGAFDPTLTPVMRLIKDAGMKWQNVNSAALDDAFASTGMQRLTLDTSHFRVAIAPDRLGRATPLELDFGGIGKGFALELAAELLRSEQFEIYDFLLDAGTSTIVASAVNCAPWRLGVGGVWKARTRHATVVELSSGALSGSGFEIQGAHVVDVRRRTAALKWQQTWVQCPNPTYADALSTAALAMSRAELSAAAHVLNARFLLARSQPPAMDRIRDPLLEIT